MRPWTRAWNSSPSPRDAARLKGWSESSSSQRPAFSASNSERVRSTMSSSTAARSSWPVSLLGHVAQGARPAHLTPGASQDLGIQDVRPDRAGHVAQEGVGQPVERPPGSSSRISSPIRSPAARSVSWARAPSLRRLTMPGSPGEATSVAGGGSGSRRGSRARGSCRVPRAPGRSPRARRRGSCAAPRSRCGRRRPGWPMGRCPAPGEGRRAASTSPPGGAAVVRRQDVRRVTALGQQQLHVATPIATITACVDAVGRQPARIGQARSVFGWTPSNAAAWATLISPSRSFPRSRDGVGTCCFAPQFNECRFW